jgi:hypothetical protein
MDMRRVMMHSGVWVALALGWAAMGPIGCGEGGAGIDRQNWRVELTLGGKRFDLKLATTPIARRQGLMHVARMPEDEGMLFVFPKSREQSFYMKNCLIDLDAIFLDARGKVVKIHEMDVPEPGAEELQHYRSGEPAQFVIELNRGMAKKVGIEEGQTLALPLADLKAMAQ